MNQPRVDTDARRGPIAWMARNSIAANLLMVILLGGGLWSAVVIQKEVFPDYLLDVVEVRVGYPGAAPSEVEQGILLPCGQREDIEPEECEQGTGGVSWQGAPIPEHERLLSTIHGRRLLRLWRVFGLSSD